MIHIIESNVKDKGFKVKNELTTIEAIKEAGSKGVAGAFIMMANYKKDRKYVTKKIEETFNFKFISLEK